MISGKSETILIKVKMETFKGETRVINYEERITIYRVPKCFHGADNFALKLPDA